MSYVHNRFLLADFQDHTTSASDTFAPIPGAGAGDVTGPASATSNAIARFDLATGKIIQNSGVIIDNSNNISGVGNITLTGTVDGRDLATDGTNQDTHLGSGDLHFSTGTTGTNIAKGTNALGAITSGTMNVCLGNNTGETLTETGDNIFIGDGCGKFVAGTGVTSAQRNVFIGSEAGKGTVTTTTHDSTAIGYRAGYAMRGGTDYNTLVGAYAGTALFNGQRNTTLGFRAGDKIYSGLRNTAVGERAGDTITTGSNNTFLGSQSDGVLNLANQTAIGYQATCDAANQIVLGNNAVTQIRTSSDNTCDLGSTAYAFKDIYLDGDVYQNSIKGEIIKTGFGAAGNNYCVGFNSLINLDVTSFGNIALGNSSGTAVTTGDNNTFLGDSAGSDITTGGTNTMLGALTDGIAAGDNQIAIGASAICDKSNQCVIGNTSLTEIVPSTNITCDLGSNLRRFGDTYTKNLKISEITTAAATPDATTLSSLDFQGHNGATYASGASIISTSSQLWNGTGYGSILDMRTNITGESAASGTSRLLVNSTGDIEISGSLDVGNILTLTNELNVASKTDVQETALTGTNGDIIYNSDKTKLRTYNNSAWKSIAQSGESVGWSSTAETGAVVICSLRRVKETYNGPCCNVRRTSDSTNADIYFHPDTNTMNKDAFDDFIGGGNGFLEIIYDQSGNGNNFQNITAGEQPQIIFETIGGNQIPYLSWNNITGDKLTCVNDTDAIGMTNNDYWYSMVFRTNVTGVRFLIGGDVSHYEVHLGGATDNIRSIPNSAADYSDVTITGQDWTDNAYHTMLLRQQGSLYVAAGSGLTSDAIFDGVLYGPADEDFVNSTTNATLTWGSRAFSGTNSYGGRLNELIIYTTAPTNTDILESNQSAFWNSGTIPGIYGTISTLESYGTNIQIEKPIYMSNMYENTLQGSLIKTGYGLAGNNFAVGDNSLSNLLPSSFGNIAIGNNAGNNITSGDRNVCIGDNAGDTVTTGGRNVMIGRTTDGIAGGENQIAIGTDATCTASDQIVLGNASVTEIRTMSNGLCDLGTTSLPFNDIHCNGVISDNFQFTAIAQAPTTATSTGTKGQIMVNDPADDGNWFFNACIADNVWRRVALSTW